MGTQSKKIDKTKAKDRKKGFQPIFQAICFDLDFCCFLILSLISLHFVGSFFCIVLASIISILRVFVLLFNTPLFIFAFLPVGFLGYFILQAYAKNPLFPKLWLVLASLFFMLFGM